MENNIKKSRLEALTDGIIAIAATIMVLELYIPNTDDWAGLLEERTTIFAYVISFFMIYVVWKMHHDLFNAVEDINRRAFLINGIWLFFLTIVPFTTRWVGSAPNAHVPEFIYPLNLLLWTLSYRIMSGEMGKDNAEIQKYIKRSRPSLIIMYIGYVISMILAFIVPVWSLRMVGIVTIVIIVRLFIASKRSNEKET